MADSRKYIIPTLLLLLGTFIYITCRQDAFLVSILPQSLLDMVTIKSIPKDNVICMFLLYNQPDGLWYSSLILFQYSINSYKYVLNISYALPFFLEFLQYFHFINGTFCFIDLLTYLLTFIILKLCLRKQ